MNRNTLIVESWFLKPSVKFHKPHKPKPKVISFSSVFLLISQTIWLFKSICFSLGSSKNQDFIVLFIIMSQFIVLMLVHRYKCLQHIKSEWQQVQWLCKCKPANLLLDNTNASKIYLRQKQSFIFFIWILAIHHTSSIPKGTEHIIINSWYET